jgi:acyl-CoA synthetase (AMP-forming)/AMP-acid ligase II
MLLPRDLGIRCARTFPESTAFIDGTRRRTWRDLHDRSDRLGAALQRLGVRAGDAVAIVAHPQLELAEHWHACLKIGALRTAINWRFAPREMLHVIRDADAKVVIVQASCGAPIGPLVAEFEQEGRHIVGFGPDHGFALDYESLLAAEQEPPVLPPLSDDDPAAISYTTGTSGLPKGAVLSQGGIREALIWASLTAGYQHADVWFQATPGTGAPHGFMVGAVTGMATVLPDGDFHPRRFLELAEEHGVTCVLFVATMMRRVIELMREGAYDLSALRLVIYGSMPTPPPLVRAAFEAFGCELQQWYGATEGSFFTCLHHEDHLRAFAGEPELLASAGRPLLHVELSIRDDQWHEVPTGTVGNVCVRGQVIMQHYRNQPQLTADVLHDGYLRMHDLGYLNDSGRLVLVDRRDFLIISGAFNIYPMVVENVVAEHAAVREVAVVGAPHPDWGEAVVAVVTLKPGKTATAEELIAFCGGRLGRFEIPKHVEFVPTLPTGPSGKILKKEVKQWFQNDPGRLSWASSTPKG